MGLLVLSRKKEEAFTILSSDGPIRVVIVEVDRGTVSVGVDAPRAVRVLRDEIMPGGAKAKA